MQTKAPIITFSRHRILSDGQGVTTLVIFHGCPLRCRWCINPYSHAQDTKRTDMTPQELYERVKVDELYFLATGGGVTFGGGEPLLYPKFIKEFKEICPDNWRISVQTSLSVPWENVEMIAPTVDMFYIDCKDADPSIYRQYTSKDNQQMVKNVKGLLTLIPPERIVVRLPLIPKYNTEADRANSRMLFEKMGIRQFDEFTYIESE